jgi:hypothetical protein
VSGEPEALEEKQREQHRRYALRTIEAKAANPGEAMGHSDEVGHAYFKCAARSASSIPINGIGGV